MISEGSRETETLGNDAKNQLRITGIHLIEKSSYFKY